MKIYILMISLFLFSNQSYALTYRSQCIGNFGKVSISIYSSEDKIFLKYNNALGSDDFPFYEGTVTKLTLPFLKIAEQELSSIDHEATLYWPIKNCSFNKANPFVMSCDGPATFITPAQTNLQSYTLITSVNKEDSLLNSYTTFKIRWGIEGEDFHHSILMPFDPKNCFAELKDK